MEIIRVEKIREGQMVSSVDGSSLDLLMGLACISNHIMRDLCEENEEADVADDILYAAKLGIERYLERRHGGEDGGAGHAVT